VDVHKGEGVRPMWTEGSRVKNVIFCGRHKWMAPNIKFDTYKLHPLVFQKPISA